MRKATKYSSLLCLISVILLIFLAGNIRNCRGPTEQISGFQSKKDRSITAGDMSPEITSESSSPPILHKVIPSEKSGQDSVYGLAGIVVSEANAPLPAAPVKLFNLPQLNGVPQLAESEWPDPLDAVTCNEGGEYFIRLSAAVPNAVVVVNKEGYVTVQDFPDLNTPRFIEKNYRLKSGPACLNVTVTDQKLKPVGGARLTAGPHIQFLAPGDRSVILRIVRTNEDGKLALSGLPEGTLGFTVSAANYLRALGTVELEAGPCRSLNVRLEPGKKIAFTVKNKLNSNISFASLTCDAGRVREVADSTGVLSLTLPPSGNPIECTVGAKGYAVKQFVLDPKTPVQAIVLENSPEIVGRVVSTSGAPVADAVVTVVGSGGSRGAAGTVRSDPSGRFSAFPPSPPVSEIRVKKEGYVEHRMVLDQSLNLDNVIITLEPSIVRFWGQVFLSNGKPASQFTLVIRNLSDQTESYIRYFEGEDGKFQVDDIPAGAYRIRVQSASPMLEGTDLSIIEIPQNRNMPMVIQLQNRKKAN